MWFKVQELTSVCDRPHQPLRNVLNPILRNREENLRARKLKSRKPEKHLCILFLGPPEISCHQPSSFK